MFITSHTYRKRSDDVILGNSGMYCSVPSLQGRAEFGLIKIHWFLASHISFRGAWNFVWGLSPQKPPWQWDCLCHVVHLARGQYQL